MAVKVLDFDLAAAVAQCVGQEFGDAACTFPDRQVRASPPVPRTSPASTQEQADAAATTAEPSVPDWESWGGPWQAFDGGSASHSFDGAEVSLLVRATDRPNLDGSAAWALTVRTCVHEDDFGVTMDVVGWLLRHATTQGWVGFVRDSVLGQVQHLVRHEDGIDLVDVRPAGQPRRVPWSSPPTSVA